MLCGLLVISALALGCAGNSGNTRADARDGRDARRETPTYGDNLAQARASLAEAEQARAAEFGNAELALAREKLRAAERAADEGEVERASQLAVEADLDVKLAVAKTRNAETQELVSEVRSGLRTLEDELLRNEQNNVSRP
jgi:hypothetical protein